MNKKFATALVIAAAALGAGTNSFAFGTSHDDGAWSGNGAQTAIALNPNGDNTTQPALHSTTSRGQVSNAVAQNREVPSPVAYNPQGPTVVAQTTFRAQQTRATVRQDVAQGRHLMAAIANNPNGDDALPQSTAQRLVSNQQQRAELAADRSARGSAE